MSRDIVPTFLKAAGVAPPRGGELDGVDLLPSLNNGSEKLPHDILCWRAGEGRAVRMGKWKLVEFGEHYSRLYDLSVDLEEKVDFSSDLPRIRSELHEAWGEWNKKMCPPAWPARYREITVNGARLRWEL